MKILHIINDLNNGGAERLLVEILPLLTKESPHEFAVLQLSERKSLPDFKKILKDAGIPLYSLSSGSIYNPVIIAELRKFILSRPFDVIHVHLFPAMYYVAMAAAGTDIPLMFTEHSTQNRRWEKGYLRVIEKMVYSRYSGIIAISPAIREKLINWTGLHSRIKLIRNGVDVLKFRNAIPYDRLQFTQSLNIPGNSVLMMMTARFIYPKDHSTVMDAVNFLPSNFHLVFAGGAGDIESAREYAIKGGNGERIHFLGFRNDIPQLMKTVDFNILSSFYEGMSGVTCEALAAGKPFLGSDVPGINDVVPNQNFLFEKQNAQMLANKVLTLVSYRSRAVLQEKEGLEFVQQFDIQTMIGKLLRMYESVTKQ